MSKKDDQRIKDFLSRVGYDPNKKPEKVEYANPDTFKLDLGTEILEVKSGLVAKIVEINTKRGIGLLPLNRQNPFVLYEWQSLFESRLTDGYICVMQP